MQDSLFAGDRQAHSRNLRIALAETRSRIPIPEQVNNGEELSYPGYIANYSKGLPHNASGEVDPAAYRRMLRALASRDPDEFEKIPLDGNGGRPLTNPQAGLSFEVEGYDPQALTMPPAPRIDSAQGAAEMVELYWMALCRDIPFIRFEDETTEAAAEDLFGLSDYRGPKRDGRVTSSTLFRGITAGDRRGPYVSQFLLKDVQFGTYRFPQRQDTVRPDIDYMTQFDTWLGVQRGRQRQLGPNDRDHRNPRYIRTPRDLAHYVHFDALYQAFLTGCLILMDIKAPVDPGNPYVWSRNQAGFGTFGGPHILSLVTEVATRALKAVWYQKWFVHRRLRPEAFGGRIDNHLSGRRRYDGILNSEVLNSAAVEHVRRRWGSYLLPQAFPEGSPTHPSYGAGHATVAGACTTILKAWFDESTVISDPVQPDEAGTKLVPYKGPDADRLTVGGELNKVASNIAVGRNMAGVHYLSDYTESIKLGEEIAVGVLRDHTRLFNEAHSFSLHRFDGRSLTI